MPASLQFELRVPDTANTRLPTRRYDPDTEDIRSILSDVCRAVERHGEFVVSGFGQDRWPVDVGTDLVIFLEQLPEVLRAVRAGLATEIDFYEQGTERKIELSPAGNAYLASCVSQGAWQPAPAVEKLDRGSLDGMLVGVRDRFMSLIEGLSPELAKHEWVQLWLAAAGPR